MIQELFGGGAAGFIGGERKISISSVLEASPSPSLSPSPSPSSSTATTTPTTSATTSENQNLRCPRCDSANTKFCYYNNYNLTQPRHFCKTCRRYWTKGGVLRNVPIGGGCRKNKSGATITTSIGKPISATGKLKTVVSSEIGQSGFGCGFDHELPSNPILLAGLTQSSHLLALLRATQNPNPNANFRFGSVKDERLMIGSSPNLGFDSLGQVPSNGLCNSFWRNNQNQNQNQNQQHQNGGFVLGEVQNTGMPSHLYQWLRSSPGNYQHHHDHTPVILGNVASCLSPTSSSTILESAPVAAAELGFWNPTLSWSDLPTTNGAYP